MLGAAGERPRSLRGGGTRGRGGGAEGGSKRKLTEGAGKEQPPAQLNSVWP